MKHDFILKGSIYFVFDVFVMFLFVPLFSMWNHFQHSTPIIFSDCFVAFVDGR